MPPHFHHYVCCIHLNTNTSILKQWCVSYQFIATQLQVQIQHFYLFYETGFFVNWPGVKLCQLRALESDWRRKGFWSLVLACFFGSLLQLTLLLQPGLLLQVQILPCMQILQHHTSHCIITLQHSQLLQQSALVVPSMQQHPPEILLGDFVAKCLCWDNALWKSFPSTLKEGFLTSSSKFHRCSITVNSLSQPKLSHEVCISALGGGVLSHCYGLWLYYTLYLLYYMMQLYIYTILYFILYYLLLQYICRSYIAYHSLYFLLPNSSFCRFTFIDNNSLYSTLCLKYHIVLLIYNSKSIIWSYLGLLFLTFLAIMF